MNTSLLNSENVYQHLIKRFPEFELYDLKGLDLHTLFSFFLSDIKKALTNKSDEIPNYFNFLNEMAESNDERILDVLGTTIYIGLFDSFPNTSTYQNFFSAKAWNMFKENIDLWEKGNNSWEEINNKPN